MINTDKTKEQDNIADNIRDIRTVENKKVHIREDNL